MVTSLDNLACVLHSIFSAFTLLSNLLLINPSRRFSVEEALESSFMSPHHRNILEFTAEPLCFPHQESVLHVDQYKELVWKLIVESIPKFGKLLDDID